MIKKAYLGEKHKLNREPTSPEIEYGWIEPVSNELYRFDDVSVVCPKRECFHPIYDLVVHIMKSL